MKKLPLHDLIIQNGIANALLSTKGKGVKYIAMDSNGDIHAYVNDNVYYSNGLGVFQWVSDFEPYKLNEHYFHIRNINPETVNPKDSFEEIDWDYLTGISSDKSKYDTTKIGDLYQALLDGYIIKTWNEYAEDHIKYLKFDQKSEEFLCNTNGSKAFHLVKNSPNSIFLNICEIYKQPTERLWLYYSYDKERGILLSQGGQFLPIEDSPPTDFSFTWVKTEEVR